MGINKQCIDVWCSLPKPCKQMVSLNHRSSCSDLLPYQLPESTGIAFLLSANRHSLPRYFDQSSSCDVRWKHGCHNESEVAESHMAVWQTQSNDRCHHSRNKAATEPQSTPSLPPIKHPHHFLQIPEATSSVRRRVGFVLLCSPAWPSPPPPSPIDCPMRPELRLAPGVAARQLPRQTATLRAATAQAPQYRIPAAATAAWRSRLRGRSGA